PRFDLLVDKSIGCVDAIAGKRAPTGVVCRVNKATLHATRYWSLRFLYGIAPFQKGEQGAPVLGRCSSISA
ncbi:hypothetical protein, partial [Pseudomonas quasicaspiana]|uniref:hypothetical protein n=1 Tax=Pseudomonas quasicaspiana TaxID=2829821 RepID=UPI001E4CDAAA